jgi:DNA-binding NarL/FixJ family response regulator
MRLVVIDDHAPFAEMVRDTIGREPDFESVHPATTLSDGLELTASTLPDLVALNVHTGPRGGLDAISQITERHPTVRVVVLTAFASEPMMRRAESAGARALHPKSAGPTRLLWVLRNTGPAGFTVHPEVLHQLHAGGPLSPQPGTSRPTPPQGIDG